MHRRVYGGHGFFPDARQPPFLAMLKSEVKFASAVIQVRILSAGTHSSTGHVEIDLGRPNHGAQKLTGSQSFSN